MNISHIALSREFVIENKQLLLDIKRNGIKTFIWGPNSIPGIDENYMIKYEMQYGYGIYADTWHSILLNETRN